MRSFILIAYKYPPYDQVGSLRWTKLTKYLARKGHTIHVITVDWTGIGSEKTLLDVQHSNIKIHNIPSGYPHKLKYKSFKNKYLNFLKSLPFRLFLDKFICFDDEAQLWKPHLLKKLEELTTLHNINIIVTTGGPFQAMRWSSLFKQSSTRAIKLIHDFRDQWAKEPFKNVSLQQRKKMQLWQDECVNSADHVVAVTNILLEDFVSSPSSKGSVITNGFDPESIPKIPEGSSPLSKEKVSLFHAGNIASGRETPLLELLNLLEKNEQLRKIYSVFLAGDLGLSTTLKLNRLFPETINSGGLTFIKRIPQSEVFKMIAASSFALHLNGPELPCANSTKIFEYGMMKKPTISINYGGEVDQLIQDHDLGYSINLERDNLEATLLEIAKNPKVEFKINISEFSHERLADKYSSLINSL
jgi:glycosyltransferase involved in cell wall biosynthesis